MPKQKRDGVDSIADLIRVESERMLSACTACGLCFEACPITPYSGIDLSSAKGVDVVHGILGILRGEPGSPDALAWARVCAGSGECNSVCPENVNPKVMVRMARMIAAGGTDGEVQIRMVDDLGHFPRMRAYARMQLDDDEVEKWLS